MILKEKLQYLYDNNIGFLLWISVFVITLTVTLMVQLVALPYLVPGWHAGDGLLIGGDWLRFHPEAINQAEKINAEGWSAWELRPRGWMPAGVASIFYTLFLPKPWVLAPLNAVVHAVTAVFLFKIIIKFIEHKKCALYATVPFLFFPSAMLWYTQLHRDGYYILGSVLLVYGLVSLFSMLTDNALAWRSILNGFLLSLSGAFIIWLVRPHAAVIIQYVCFLLLLFYIAVLIIMAIRKNIKLKGYGKNIIAAFLMISIVGQLTDTDGATKYQVDLKNNNQTQHSTIVEDSAINNAEEIEYFYWENTGWLPERIEAQLFSMSNLRSVHYPSRFGGGLSRIDSDVTLNSFYDYLRYLPRALHVAFLAPFPSHWFAEGSDGSTTIFRRVSAFEMIFVYIMLVFLILGIWMWRRSIEIYILVSYCILMVLPIVYSIPNVGTIYRYRYGFLMLLVSLGVGVCCEYISDRKHNSGKPYSLEK